MVTRVKRWAATLNNWTDQEYNIVVNFCEAKAQYAIIAKEIGGAEGTPHLQCYFNFKRKITLGGLKKKIGTRWHLEKCEGTEKENVTYCSKGGDYIEIGARPGVATLSAVRDAFSNGHSMKTLV